MNDRPILGQHYLAQLRHALAVRLLHAADLNDDGERLIKAGIEALTYECRDAGVWPEAKHALMEAERREREARR